MIDTICLIFYNNFIGGNELPPLLQMQFWTPERCKTLSTEVLTAYQCDFIYNAKMAKTEQAKARNTSIAQIIDAELRTRF